MSNVAIRVENIGKRYRRGEDVPYRRLSEMLQGIPAAALRAARGSLRPRTQSAADSTGRHGDFWALKDVSFDVQEGEVLGVIGRNGAGKSTLLKVLSRITEPTTGRFGVRGRLASLLEVGTGFHPELTGRENIYLSGTILGMSRAEIKRHFDEIVAFAEIDEFLDTPVKRYSSGMYVRLGFAIAAHLQPEILIVDEVLAVGDAAFQKKCLGKMGDIAKSGRTVLFVSHNMTAVGQLTSRVVLLEQGSARTDLAPTEAFRRYRNLETTFQAFENGKLKIADAWLSDQSGCRTCEVEATAGFGVSFELELRGSKLANPSFGFEFRDGLGRSFARVTTREAIGTISSVAQGGTISVQLPPTNLLPGEYSLSIGVSDGPVQIAFLENAIPLFVRNRQTNSLNQAKLGHILYVDSQWSLNCN
ncbi:ABC transporter ATP-binding protein [Blastopirellula marina]|uniref:ABC transporter ATP-binding protein n=1 Tax=Blastopirellula marina TaxID=124 RepID=UPI001304C686|nr:ABC transporter ATP-binding protein [Blastopirellula marina]